MKKWMKSIYSGFHEIGVIGDVLSKWSDLNILPCLNQNHIIRFDQSDYVAGITGSASVELIIIDLDTFGVERTRFLIFLASCFNPQTSLVLITEQALPDYIRKTLYAGRVLGIIELNNSIDTPTVART